MGTFRELKINLKSLKVASQNSAGFTSNESYYLRYKKKKKLTPSDYTRKYIVHISEVSCMRTETNKRVVQ